MLSICIPTYNTDCSELLNILQKQIGKLDKAVEVLVCDDFSNNHLLNNQKACERNGFVFFENKKKLGRILTRIKLVKNRPKIDNLANTRKLRQIEFSRYLFSSFESNLGPVVRFEKKIIFFSSRFSGATGTVANLAKIFLGLIWSFTFGLPYEISTWSKNRKISKKSENFKMMIYA